MVSMNHIWVRTVLLKIVLPGIASSEVEHCGVVLLLETVTVTGAEVVRLPAASRAIAVSVWEPLVAVVVSQATP